MKYKYPERIVIVENCPEPPSGKVQKFLLAADIERLRRAHRGLPDGDVNAAIRYYTTSSVPPDSAKVRTTCPGSATGRRSLFHQPRQSLHGRDDRPQTPTYFALFFAARIAIDSSAFTASLRSRQTVQTITPEYRDPAPAPAASCR